MFLARQPAALRCGVAAAWLLTALCGCAPLRSARVQPQPRYVAAPAAPAESNLTASADTLPGPSQVLSVRQVSEPPGVSTSAVANGPFGRPEGRRTHQHRNPDSYPMQRFSRWYHTEPVGHVGPQRSEVIDYQSKSRKTHRLAWVALGLSVLAYGMFLLAGGSALVWVLTVTMPLTGTLLGVASLTTINRHRDRYRGKGWAMAAIILGSGVLGMGLIALAGLATSKVVWK